MLLASTVYTVHVSLAVDRIRSAAIYIQHSAVLIGSQVQQCSHVRSFEHVVLWTCGGETDFRTCLEFDPRMRSLQGLFPSWKLTNKSYTLTNVEMRLKGSKY